MQKLTITNHATKNQKNYNENAIEHGKIGLNSTLYLAYRDIPDLLEKYLFSMTPKEQYQLLDFGCGAGLSTEIIQKIIENCGHKVNVHGIDLNENNLTLARKRLPQGIFEKVEKGQLPEQFNNKFDIVICNFVLVENQYEEMVNLLKRIQPTLCETGILIVTNPTAKAYNTSNKWYTFNNNFDENTPLGSNGKLADGQPIKVEVLSLEEKTSFTFFDFFHSGHAYRSAYEKTGFCLAGTHKPLGKNEDNIQWQSEYEKPPYKIHVLYKQPESYKPSDNSTVEIQKPGF